MEIKKALSNICKVPLFIIGTSKNAGKTTILNRLIYECKLKDINNIGICTIGYDGETKDQLFETEKPEITVYKNMIVTTSAKALYKSNALFEILDTFNYETTLGRIVVAKVLREGNIELTSVGTNKQVEYAVNRMKEYNCERIYVDGAVNRKTQVFSSSVILAVSSQLGYSIDIAVSKLKYIIEHYLLEKTDISNIIKNKFNYFIKKKIVNTTNIIDSEKLKKSDEFYCFEPLTDSNAKIILASKFRGNIIIDSCSKLFLTEAIYKKLLTNNISIKVINKKNIEAICINSFSVSNSISFDADEFYRKTLDISMDIPVYDVLMVN